MTTEELARQLCDLNRQRQNIESEIRHLKFANDNHVGAVVLLNILEIYAR